jgi:hypothetical protein
MDNCRSCDAKLSPDIDWCPQCYTRTGPFQPAMTPAPAPATATTVAPPASRGAMQPLLPREMPTDLLIHQFQTGHHSRTKAGEVSFGWMGRTMLSIGVFILGVIGYFVVIGNIGITPGWKSFEMYLPVFFIVGGAMLWGVWRPSRVDSRHR